MAAIRAYGTHHEFILYNKHSPATSINQGVRLRHLEEISSFAGLM
jgi:hypothetical protein